MIQAEMAQLVQSTKTKPPSYCWRIYDIFDLPKHSMTHNTRGGGIRIFLEVSIKAKYIHWKVKIQKRSWANFTKEMMRNVDKK